MINNNIVAVKQNNIIVTSFHPELTTDSSVHRLFISVIQASNDNKLQKIDV